MRRLVSASCALIIGICLFANAAANGLPAVIKQEQLKYATQFELARMEDGSTLLTIAGGDRFLIIPPDSAIPSDLPDDVTPLQQPLDCIYLAATSAMDMFVELDCIDRIRLSGTQESGWHIPEAVQAMQCGNMLYAGKYSAPDFELMLESNCRLAIESSMIYHAPDIIEQLELLGIPVLVERSSYENHPLGRMEWIRFYGALLGCDEAAESMFNDQLAKLDSILSRECTGKSVAFFHVNSRGLVSVRKPNDYISRAIELAGGEYALASVVDDGTALSTMNMQMENFYTDARSADYIIYNSAIVGELSSLDQLLDISELFADFKAVRDGHVYCTEQNLFQESMGIGTLIQDIHLMLTEDQPDAQELTYLFRLE